MSKPDSADTDSEGQKDAANRDDLYQIESEPPRTSHSHLLR